MSQTEQRVRRERKEQEEVWTPRTSLGIMVNTGKITSMKEIYENQALVSGLERGRRAYRR